MPSLKDLAACTGRLSAVTEDSWHDGGAAADIAALRRDAMADVLDAVTPAGMKAEVMAWRIEAKAAQAALLAQARFGPAPRAAIATRQALERVTGCLSLVS